MTTQLRIGAIALLVVGILTSSVHAVGAEDNSGALRTDVARLQADIAQLRMELASLQRQAGVNGPEYRVGSVANRRIDVLGRYGSIVIDKDGIAIRADKIRLNGKELTLDSARSFDVKADAIRLNSRLFEQKGNGETILKGSKIPQN